MPIYEYQCKKCGDHFEVEQRMTDDALKTHDQCGGDVVKVFSSAGIVFKGSGFHKTDARKKTASATSSTSDSKTSQESPSNKNASDPVKTEKSTGDTSKKKADSNTKS